MFSFDNQLTLSDFQYDFHITIRYWTVMAARRREKGTIHEGFMSHECKKRFAKATSSSGNKAFYCSI